MTDTMTMIIARYGGANAILSSHLRPNHFYLKFIFLSLVRIVYSQIHITLMWDSWYVSYNNTNSAHYVQWFTIKSQSRTQQPQKYKYAGENGTNKKDDKKARKKIQRNILFACRAFRLPCPSSGKSRHSNSNKIGINEELWADDKKSHNNKGT